MGPTTERISTLTSSPPRSRSPTLTPLTQAADRRPRGRGGGTKSWSLTVKEEGGGVHANLGQRGNSDEAPRMHDEAGRVIEEARSSARRFLFNIFSSVNA